MIALSGVRSSCDMLARNSDLCLFAVSSCRLLSWISRNRRDILDRDARLVGKGLTSAMSFSEKGRISMRHSAITPMALSSLISGTASTVSLPMRACICVRRDNRRRTPARGHRYERRAPVENGTSRDQPSIAGNDLAHGILGAAGPRRCTIRPSTSVDHCVRRVAQVQRAFGHGLSRHGLHIGRRVRDHARISLIAVC